MKRDEKNIVRGKILFSLFLLLSLFFVAGCVSSDMGGYLNFPPLLTYTPHDPVTGEENKLRALGPLLEFRKEPGEVEEEKKTFFAFRPLVSYESSPEETNWDIFWPFSVYRKNSRGTLFRAFPCFFACREEGEREFLFFPFFYYGQDARKRDSFFFFPFYGKLQRGVAGRNITFLLFPLYCHTEKGMTKGHSFLWPLLHYEKSPRHIKMRFFPLAAFREDYDLRRYYSFFWPLFNYAYSLDPKKKDFAFLSVPLGGYESWGSIRNGSILWPFFTWQKNGDGVSFYGPWPFFRYGKGKNQTGHLFFWPLAGSAKAPGTSYSYFLWPSGFYLQNRTPGNKRSRFLCMLPFYLSHTAYSRDGKIEKSYRHIYPFFSRRKEKDEVLQRAPDLTPVRRSYEAERNYLELFTFYKSRSNKKGLSWEILWGMARHISGKDKSLLAIGPFYMHVMDKKEDSLLLDIFFGCVKVYKRGKESCVRLFHLVEIGKVTPKEEKGRKK